MRKAKTIVLHNNPDSVNLETWLHSLQDKYNTQQLATIRQAAALAQLTGRERATPTSQSCFHQSLVMGEILAELNMDSETLAAGVLYSCVRYAELSLEDVNEQFGNRINKLIIGVKEMDVIRALHERISHTQQHANIDNLRKMLLSIVNDVRIVIIKLAERLYSLRHMALFSEEEKEREAKEVMELYAPLANRLGIGHLKWELEDLSFRYLNPDAYKTISKGLNQRREAREHYVQNVIRLLEQGIRSLGVHEMEVTGRAKHIYSIYRKMTRKKVGLEEIYDAIAFRVLVPTVEDCYSALSYVHGLWEHIPKEFDDYVTKPKPNGYRSIHTAVIGPEQKQIEIQIRTFGMHQESELGVAAHWVYKEGGGQAKGSYEAKIAWLRQLMDWQKEVTEIDQQIEAVAQVFAEQIYVFTPNGDVVELPQGATPLDFAYHIHSEVGHRCRGAKVNNHIVPLTYALNTGEVVEILTTKQSHPSRDWLNPHLGYLMTSRAKAKVLNWFRKQEYEQNVHDGREILEKELKRLGLKNVDISGIAENLHYKNTDELYAGLGRGDVHLSNLLGALEDYLEPKEEEKLDTPTTIVVKPKSIHAPTDVEVEGVDNLLTHMALCCKPIPGDEIVGYVTIGKGVSIHRKDCVNIAHSNHIQQDRLIHVSWGHNILQKYAVDISVVAYDRPGLIRDISNVLANEHTSILSINTTVDKKTNTAYIKLTIELANLNPLNRLLAHINQLPNITEVKRLG